MSTWATVLFIVVKYNFIFGLGLFIGIVESKKSTEFCQPWLKFNWEWDVQKLSDLKSYDSQASLNPNYSHVPKWDLLLHDVNEGKSALSPLQRDDRIYNRI